MPSALQRFCTQPGCGTLVVKGRCQAHQRNHRRARSAATPLAYNETWWRSFRLRFFAMLSQAGLVAMCGTSLHGGPVVALSRCKAEGRMTLSNPDGSDLHLHHEPPLTVEEARDRSVVCNPYRIAL